MEKITRIEDSRRCKQAERHPVGPDTGSVVPLRARRAPRISECAQPDTGSNGYDVSVSVIVPTCGRNDLLTRCLNALTMQTLDPALYEIIVVDDGPSYRTRQVVDEWTELMSVRQIVIRYIANNGTRGPAAARNLGWRAAHAPIIAFTDDDTVPTPNWLMNGLAAFDDQVHAITGRVEMPLPSTPSDYESDANRLELSEFVTANCFCRKRVLASVNGFDERFRLAWREDSDLHFNLLECNANILQVPQAVVVHPVRQASWGVSIFQQRKILFDALLYKKHPRLYRQKIRAAPRWDYYLTVLALLTSLIALAFGNIVLFAMATGGWLAMTIAFFLKRVRYTRKTPSHIAEMLVTSILIPPLAVFWRMVGAYKFRVRFL